MEQEQSRESEEVKSSEPRDSDGASRAARHAARARQTWLAAARSVQEVTGLESPERAFEALDIVVSGIVRRITPSEATDFVAQLPSEYHDRWLGQPAGPDRRVTREKVMHELSTHLGLDSQRADDVLRRVGIALTDLVSEGELEQVRSQLPEGFRDILWSSASP